ncbi:MAG TPA: GNAT family N-acetyltransferase, partial [Holophaga sp.]|nr:GNAT family N-acetyltransferase [Holophaga sp.]
MNIREVETDDLPQLDAIAFRAKAHWGYPQELIEAWRGDLVTAPGTLHTRPTFLAERSGVPIAFAQIDPEAKPWELVAMWVDPDHMGKGVGKALLRHMLACARTAGQAELVIDSDPFAKGFYLACGAREAGQVQAPIPGQPDRVRPRLTISTDAHRTLVQASIRPARCDDARNLAALAIQVWLHTYATTGIRATLSDYVLNEYTASRFQERCADPAHLVLLAEVDAHLVGFADLDFEAPRGDVPDTRTELATLYVQE